VADLTVDLRWSGEALTFHGGRSGGPQIVLDGDGGVAGPSPVAALLLSLAGCMAADVVLIGRKMRLPLQGVEVVVEGDRREEPPRRLTGVRLKYIVTGVAPDDEAKVWRAIEMSRDTYCSVLHSLRPDTPVSIELELR
jgi:putative redox protein